MNLSDMLMYRSIFGSDGGPSNSLIGVVGGWTDVKDTVPTMELLEMPGITLYRMADSIPDMFYGVVLSTFTGEAEEYKTAYFGASPSGTPPFMIANTTGAVAMDADGEVAFVDIPDGSEMIEGTTATQYGLYISGKYLEHIAWSLTYFKKPT